MTAIQRPHHHRDGWAMTALGRMIGTFRYVNAELERANEAIFRPVGAPRAHRGGNPRPT
jgi:hypothetical protein